MSVGTAAAVSFADCSGIAMAATVVTTMSRIDGIRFQIVNVLHPLLPYQVFDADSEVPRNLL